MAGEEKIEDWEVVSPMAAAYEAVAPRPNHFDNECPDEEVNGGNMVSDPLFMSRHFVFPPNEHENLFKEPECSDINKETCYEDVNPAEEDKGATKQTGEEVWKVKTDHRLQGMDLFDEGKSFNSMDFGRSKTFEGLSFVEEDNTLYCGPGFDDLNIEIREQVDKMEQDNPSQNVQGSPLENRNVPRSNDENKCVKSGVPSEAWWRRRAAYLYSQAKEANSFWSIVVAAALMGFVILGQQWQREKLQVQQLKWQFSISEEVKRSGGRYDRKWSRRVLAKELHSLPWIVIVSWMVRLKDNFLEDI